MRVPMFEVRLGQYAGTYDLDQPLLEDVSRFNAYSSIIGCVV